jgi:hypothetical protein
VANLTKEKHAKNKHMQRGMILMAMRAGHDVTQSLTIVWPDFLRMKNKYSILIIVKCYVMKEYIIFNGTQLFLQSSVAKVKDGGSVQV